MKGTEVAVAVRVTDRDGRYPILGHIVAGINESLGYYATAERSFFEYCRDMWSGGRKYSVQTKRGPSPCFDTKDGATMVRFMGLYPDADMVPDGYRRMLGDYKV